MVSTVSSRANYYDALGLSPAASQDEIAKAFGKAMGLFGARSASAAAQLAIAFETLRNPVKRRAYDDSIGVAPEPQPVQAPTSVSFRISAHVPAVEPQVEQRAPQPEPAPEPGPSSFIASSLREIARPVALDPPPRPVAAELPPRRQALDLEAEPAFAAEVEEGPIDWRRPAIAVAGVVLAAGLVGALAGVSVKDDEQGQHAPAVTAAVPAARPRPSLTPPAMPADSSPVQVRTVPAAAERPVRLERVAKRAEEVAAAQPAQEQAPTDVVAASTQTDEAPADPLAPEAQAPTIQAVAAAGLPLASKLVARTIDRIGYACGEVASATPADGAGVYKVTCTSGQTYQARPVHGRYRFRRWGSH